MVATAAQASAKLNDAAVTNRINTKTRLSLQRRLPCHAHACLQTGPNVNDAAMTSHPGSLMATTVVQTRANVNDAAVTSHIGTKNN